MSDDQTLAPGSKYDRAHVEQWTLGLQRHYYKIEPLEPVTLSLLEGWLKDELPSACTFHRWETGASCNHDIEILGAAVACRDAGMVAQARKAFATYLRCQLGELDPASLNLPPLLRFFGGHEQLSSDYEPMRLRAIASLRLHAIGRAIGLDAADPENATINEELRLTAFYLTAFTDLHDMCNADTPDGRVHAANHGGLFYGGPALSPVGGRSNHFGQCESEPLWCLTSVTKAQWAENRYNDALPFFRLLDGNFGVPPTQDLTILSRLRFQERQHFVRFDNGESASWVERQPSHLSPSYMAWVYRRSTMSADVGFPFLPDRKNRGKDNDYRLATCQESQPDRYLVIQGGTMVVSPIALTGTETEHVVVRPDGPPEGLGLDSTGEADPSTQTLVSPPTAPVAAPSKHPWWRKFF